MTNKIANGTGTVKQSELIKLNRGIVLTVEA